MNAATKTGSPPRRRGKEALELNREQMERITPAWAGKSFDSLTVCRRLRDHPRVGGEKTRGKGGRCPTLGSPPRGRGKVVSTKNSKGISRITPAWAGKRHSMYQRETGAKDHPRVGGEKSPHAACCPRWIGSPPRGRGKVPFFRRFVTIAGITPAWAGKSKNGCVELSQCKDHPRVGGEKPISNLCLFWVKGSPPRGRGKDWAKTGAYNAQGITPAWAGKSTTARRLWPPSRDHPRMGGEKSMARMSSSSMRGSPPHGRGKAAAPPHPARFSGITPAWAGKRPLSAYQPFFAGDHPRMGGEKLALQQLHFLGVGSPPHGRGKDTQFPVKVAQDGITPAWAGKSATSAFCISTA